MEKEKDITILSAKRFLTATTDTSIALKVYDIGNLFAEVKNKLAALYGADTAVVADGAEVKLSDMTAAETVEVSAIPDFDKPSYNVFDAMRIMARLMRKGDGCPWDSVQTHDSIRINMIEEAYEAVDAIDKRDLENMREEFGDVLLQSLLQSEISKRDGEFDFDAVCDGLCKKLISRHTFIFGDDSAAGADDAITLWEKNKAKEKHALTLKEKLSRIPGNFPSLLLAQKVYKKTKAVEKVDPKAELDRALKCGDFVGAIDALTAMLADEGKDAEVELNARIKDRIASL